MRGCGILSLPVEIRDDIFDLLSFSDHVALASTCLQLYVFYRAAPLGQSEPAMNVWRMACEEVNLGRPVLLPGGRILKDPPSWTSVAMVAGRHSATCKLPLCRVQPGPYDHPRAFEDEVITEWRPWSSWRAYQRAQRRPMTTDLLYTSHANLHPAITVNEDFETGCRIFFGADDTWPFDAVVEQVEKDSLGSIKRSLRVLRHPTLFCHYVQSRALSRTVLKLMSPRDDLEWCSLIVNADGLTISDIATTVLQIMQQPIDEDHLRHLRAGLHWPSEPALDSIARSNARQVEKSFANQTVTRADYLRARTPAQESKFACEPNSYDLALRYGPARIVGLHTSKEWHGGYGVCGVMCVACMEFGVVSAASARGRRPGISLALDKSSNQYRIDVLLSGQLSPVLAV